MEGLCGAVLTSVTNCGLRICSSAINEGDEAEKIEENWKKLERAYSSLNAKKQDIEGKIKENSVTKKTTKQWDNWVKEVGEIGEEVKNLEKKHKRAKRFHYITCRFLSQAKLSRNMATKADEIYRVANGMTDDLAMTDRELVTTPSPSFRKTPEPAWVKKNVDRIMKFLKEEDVKKIGLWAFAGMGKTTIMESLKDNLLGSGLFEHVLFVTVGEEDSEERTRQSILEQLKLNIGRTGSSHQTALVISSALKDKKYLLILDQVSQEMDFRKLGIHDDHMKGKVVLATRYKAVCDKLKMDESFELKQMSEDDARMLFRKIVGEKAEHKSKKYDAELIVKECGGIPLLIDAVATYLRTVDNDQIWSNTRLKLQSSTYDDLEHFSDSHNVFKLVYGRLQDYRKKCFLYGALYPEDHEIYEDHLMECWRAEQFIPHAGTSSNVQIFRRARLEGHATIKSLIDACLLKRCKKVNYVTMPNLFRTWALKTDEGGSALVNPMNEREKFQSAKWISLKCEDLRTLLEQVNFNRVTTLFLQRNEIQGLTLDPVFVLKSKLRVVDLGYTSITSLPSSIANLINLKALYLNNCAKLSELPAEIVDLKHVEILDISQTGIPYWPGEIGSMVGLRCLRVSFSRNVGIYYSHTQVPVIGRLSSLEELSIVVDEDYQNQWNGIFMDDKWNKVVQGITEEVATLEYLTTLRIYFPSIKCLEDFVEKSKSWKNMDGQWRDRTFRSFKIVVGSFWKHQEVDISEHKAERHLKVFAYNESSTDDGYCSTISKVLTQVCTFELIGHRTLTHLSRFGTDSLEGLKVCAIKDCKKMSSVICGNYEGDVVLKELKQLHLINLRGLTCICDGLVGEESFANLTTLKIDNCPALTVILSSKMTQRMTSLEHLRVENCLETVVITQGCEQQEENNPSTMLPRLKSLELINLPNLEKICQNFTMKWNALRAIEVYQCPKLQSFSLVLNSVENLRLIKCQDSWWNQLDLESDVRNRFQSFCQFISRVEINAGEIV